jgi:hypothetical protein
MKFTTHETDLLVLPESTKEETLLVNYCKENNISISRQFSNVAGQDWHGKIFYDIPFCAGLREQIEKHCIKMEIVRFDDAERDENGNIWSQICSSCAKKYYSQSLNLDESGSGICGVQGCENQADYYIDNLLEENLFIHSN